MAWLLTTHAMSNRKSPFTAGKSVALLGTVLIVLVAMVAAPVAAHDSEEIDGYKLTFGGADEPVITGERMWLQLRIRDEDGEPVPGQAESMVWRVEKPGDSDPVELKVSESHGNPGLYEAAVVFTEPGEYAVHIEGTVEETEVHTHFEKVVEDQSALAYPESDEPEEAAGLGFGPDLGIGLVIGAVVAIVAFFIGRRFTSTPSKQPTAESAE